MDMEEKSERERLRRSIKEWKTHYFDSVPDEDFYDTVLGCIPRIQRYMENELRARFFKLKDLHSTMMNFVTHYGTRSLDTSSEEEEVKEFKKRRAAKMASRKRRQEKMERKEEERRKKKAARRRYFERTENYTIVYYSSTESSSEESTSEESSSSDDTYSYASEYYCYLSSTMYPMFKKLLRVPRFSGQRSEWREFSEKFKTIVLAEEEYLAEDKLLFFERCLQEEALEKFNAQNFKSIEEALEYFEMHYSEEVLCISEDYFK